MAERPQKPSAARGPDDPKRFDIGMVGLGVMGQNFALNMADNGFAVAGYDLDASRRQALVQAAGGLDVAVAPTTAAFVDLLRAPRAVMMLVPAGKVVDQVIRDLLPHLSPGDVVIDGGNSFFEDTDLRAKALAEHGIDYLGVGISGGEEGARHGPSIMPGGPALAYERVQPILEAAAAKFGDEPCVAYLGPGSVGHFVKMVHNGIEYGMMQLIAESYDLMKRGLGLTDDELHDVFAAWSAAELNAYLTEITADIFTHVDDVTGKRLIEVIEDAAKQKGTGMWTSQAAMNLHVPVPTIDVAVMMRNLSAAEGQRATAFEVYDRKIRGLEGNREAMLAHLRSSLYVGFLSAYVQGLTLLRSASQAYGYGLDLRTVVRVWRGGCIIRSSMLEDILSLLEAEPDSENLLVTAGAAEKVKPHEWDLRRLVATAAEVGVPMPAFMSVLAHLDALTAGWLPANLIQAQRDLFGAHTYERVDRKGSFHTEWETERPAEGEAQPKGAG